MRQAFPTDVWIKRIVEHLYFSGEDLKTQEIREFGIDRFGDFAGYVQLYLFHYARKSGLMDNLNTKKG
jgi:N-glycosylase/DNA lyase